MAGTRKRGTRTNGGGRAHYATLVRRLVRELQAYGYPRLMIWGEIERLSSHYHRGKGVLPRFQDNPQDLPPIPLQDHLDWHRLIRLLRGKQPRTHLKLPDQTGSVGAAGECALLWLALLTLLLLPALIR